MPFIGQEPLTGAYHVLDAITTSATATYNLQLNSGAFSPATANQLLVSLNGVIQKPGSSFTISGSQITFSSALTSSDSIDFIIALGDVLNVGTPTDGTVTAGKIASGAVTDAKIASGITASKLTGALPAISGAALTGISQDFVKLNTIAAETSGVTTFDVSLDTTDTYQEQRIVIKSLYGSAAFDLYARFIEGGSQVTGASDYAFIYIGRRTGVATEGNANNSQSYMRFNWYGLGDAANEVHDVVINVRHHQDSSTRTTLDGTANGLAGSANISSNIFYARRSSAAEAEAIKFFSNSSSYNLFHGGIEVYGVK